MTDDRTNTRMTPAPMLQVHARLPETLRRWITQNAAARGLTENTIITLAVEMYRDDWEYVAAAEIDRNREGDAY